MDTIVAWNSWIDVYKEQLIPVIEELNVDMRILHDLIVDNCLDDRNIEEEKKQELNLVLTRILEKKWIAGLLPALEWILSWYDYSPGWLEHMLSFQYGASSEEMLADNLTLGQILSTTNSWRIIWPLLIRVISEGQIVIPMDKFQLWWGAFLTSSKSTPKVVRDRIWALLKDN